MPMTRDIHLRRGAAIAAVVVLVLVGAAIGSVTTAKAVSGRNVPIFVAGSQPAVSGSVTIATGFAPVVRVVAPSVVNISSSRVVKNQPNPFFSDPLFRQFFGDQFPGLQRPRRQRETSLGSGMVISPDGYILTNNHVVEGAQQVKVYLADKREFPAKVIGTDPRTDVAVLKISATNLTPIHFGDSTKIAIGDFCLAFGDPFGIGQTVTAGIISATGRSGLGIESYEDFIQTDASINPGNSGGPLVNVNGELIGMNTAILSGQSGGNQGIGFAIPVNMARGVTEQILKKGKVVRSWLGIIPQDVTQENAKFFGLEQPKGVIVSQVEPNSPAARAGLKQGDVLLDMNGQPIQDVNTFRLKVSMMAPGTDLRLRVLRNGAQQDVTAHLEEMPANQAQRGAGGGQGGGAEGGALEGLSVDTLTPDIAQDLKLPPGTKGVVVTAVDPGSTASDAGIARGDVIQEVNRKRVTNVDEFAAAIRQAGKNPVLLLINRGGVTQYVTITPE